jgi:hypothetical protein
VTGGADNETGEAEERVRLEIATGLHNAAGDGLLEPIEALERSIRTANAAADERTAAWQERDTIANPIVLEEESALGAFEALASGADADLDGRARTVAEAAVRVGVLDVELRIADQMLEHAIRAVLAQVQPKPVLGVLRAAVDRLFAEAVAAVEGFPTGATVEEIMRGSTDGVEAFQRLDRAAAGYGRCRAIFERFVPIGGYDWDGGRAAHVHAESTDPRAVERFATPEGRQVKDPRLARRSRGPMSPSSIRRSEPRPRDGDSRSSREPLSRRGCRRRPSSVPPSSRPASSRRRWRCLNGPVLPASDVGVERPEGGDPNGVVALRPSIVRSRGREGWGHQVNAPADYRRPKALSRAPESHGFGHSPDIRSIRCHDDRSPSSSRCSRAVRASGSSIASRGRGRRRTPRRVRGDLSRWMSAGCTTELSGSSCRWDTSAKSISRR